MLMQEKIQGMSSSPKSSTKNSRGPLSKIVVANCEYK